MIKKVAAVSIALGISGLWLTLDLTIGVVSVLILSLAISLMWMGYLLPNMRVLLVSLGFYCLMTGSFAAYSNWLPQVRADVPPELVLAAGSIESMSVEALSEMGEMIIFGRVTGGNPNDADVGKGQCPLCHTVSGTVRRDRGPNLTAADEATKVPIGQRAEIRLKDERYTSFGKQVAESFKGSGRARTAAEYIAESHACPSCYVVAGFGNKGTNDTQSPMPIIHKPPISLSIDELIAVDTYLFTKDGLQPPSTGQIRAAYERFIPAADRPKKEKAKPKAAGPPVALPKDTPAEIIKKMACFACHMIPTIPGASSGMIGPMLIEGHNAARRIKSSAYKSDIKGGTAAAKTARDYVMESIMDPNAHVVSAFGIPGQSAMPKNFNERFTIKALDNLVDFLLSLNCDTAREAGLTGPPQEPIDKVCGPAGGSAEISSDTRLAAVK